ncbi:hypothetical protein HC031_04915 [Planosporangium thailandense]|uniref:Peptidoglycan-binding protein n=1 Tax=Planosporangium thailandense TaxID=765197 RepID=A0ABX0XT50_9ACTN|nr:hypothetical protein [Planosporangium thailandense]NJC69067.1 hypothetical protein [Planosporangium thailandense]
MGGTALERLEKIKKAIDDHYGFLGVTLLLREVERAQREPPPRGSVDELDKRVAALRAAAHECDAQRTFARTEVRDRVSAVWTGTAADRAETCAMAFDHELRRTGEVFDEAAQALARFVEAIGEARATDRRGRGHLEYAVSLLDGLRLRGPFDYDNATMEHAHNEAKAGISAMVAGARHLDEASRLLARQFAELSARAHAARMRLTGLDNLEQLVIADAAVPGGPYDANLILTAAAASRADANLFTLSRDDRRSFIGLVHECRSPQEQAYLLQALAAGYSVKEIRAFDSKIHDHAGDPRWLRQHLTPIGEIAGPDRLHRRRPVEFGGRPWAQGPEPTCVAMSTVLARAKVDPLYALELTTGGHPGDPAYDNGDAFARRLRDEQHRVYDGGRNWLQDLFGRDGMTEGQARDVADEQVASHTGAHYDQVSVDSTGDRRNVLPDVEKSVDQGLPVTFTVSDGRQGHEMAIVGRQGDMLEVYNPWGYTVWVSEDDFVHNRMNVVGDGVPAAVHAVNVARR